MSSPSPDVSSWVPDRHLQVVAAMAHADEILEEIYGLVFNYVAQPGGGLQLREERVEHVNRLIVGRVAPVPRKLPLLVADVLVTLRGSLEHVLFAEAEYLNNGPLTHNAARQVAIPAMTNSSDFMGWLKSRNKTGPDSLAEGGALVDRIQRLQPFSDTGDQKSHPLARLTSYTNHFKHRAPAVTATSVPAIYRDSELRNAEPGVANRPRTPTTVGDTLIETPVGQRVPLTLWPSLGLNRPGTEEWPLLVDELNECMDWVRGTALPVLITGGPTTNELLPARYAIDVGHHDERHAITTGSWESSHERFKQRLNAAVARENLPGMLETLPGAPPADAIKAWVTSLTDAEVNERMSTIVLTGQRGPTRKMIGALQQLAEQAAVFAREQPEKAHRP